MPARKLVIAVDVAEPEVNVTALPKGTPSPKNWTVPVAVPAPGETAATVAVNVTDCPKTEGVVEANAVVVVMVATV